MIGYAGRMGSQDGMLEAVETLGILEDDVPTGTPSSPATGRRAHARERAAAVGIADAVDFVGFVEGRERLVELLASCDVCISPEPKNPLNDQSTLIKVAEYMAVGKPTVAFDLHETRITAQGAATLVSSLEGFANEIGLLFDDQARRERMGRVGRERVLATALLATIGGASPRGLRSGARARESADRRASCHPEHQFQRTDLLARTDPVRASRLPVRRPRACALTQTSNTWWPPEPRLQKGGVTSHRLLQLNPVDEHAEPSRKRGRE